MLGRDVYTLGRSCFNGVMVVLKAALAGVGALNAREADARDRKQLALEHRRVAIVW